MKLLHDDEHLLGGLEHALQVDDARVMEVLVAIEVILSLNHHFIWFYIGKGGLSRSYLQNGHFVPQLTLLFGGKPHLVDDFDGHISARLSVFSLRIRGGADESPALRLTLTFSPHIHQSSDDVLSCRKVSPP